MSVGNITQSISIIPAPPHRGVDVQTVFVTKQEDFQDHLAGTTVTELNTLKDQLNTRIGEINSTATTMNGYADTASAGASTATTKAGEASASASEALVSKNQAGSFKIGASTSASTATTKASEASASALSASTSASTATTKASEASASASTATTKAGEASASASTATTKAGEASASALSASTSASTATTKAGEASTSASQALTSRNQAETFAQQAQASALNVDANNIVYRTGDETIAGVKTFSSNIVGNITGNAGTATIAADSNKLIGKNWYWSGQGGQPTWLWGGNDENSANMYVYNPSNFSVKYADSAGYANSAGYATTVAVGTNNTQIATTAFVLANSNAVTATTVGYATAALRAGGVGSYALLSIPDGNPSLPDSTIAGSLLKYASASTASTISPSGTWRCMGYISGGSYITLFLRIA